MSEFKEVEIQIGRWEQRANQLREQTAILENMFKEEKDAWRLIEITDKIYDKELEAMSKDKLIDTRKEDLVRIKKQIAEQTKEINAKMEGIVKPLLGENIEDNSISAVMAGIKYRWNKKAWPNHHQKWTDYQHAKQITEWLSVQKNQSQLEKV